MNPVQLVPPADPRAAAALTAGSTGAATTPDPALGLPALTMGDGPLGLVDSEGDERATTWLLPCGTALAATWDPDAVTAVAGVLGSEAAQRGFAAVYAPNLNLPRTGSSGRAYEMLSEDPLLTAVLGAAFVEGVQRHGVVSCPKHLVCNDTETERQRMSARVDEVSLRETYLQPFEAAVAAGAGMLMAAYNRLNGTPCTEHAELLSIVKDEWGFDGVVVSDYFALRGTTAPALAGTDLEMPGPAIHFGQRLAEAVEAGEVPRERLDDAAARLLRLARRVADGRAAAAAPVPDAEALRVLTATAARAAVLVRNEGDLLPLDPERLRRLAVVGPNAVRPVFQGATFGRVRARGEVPTPAQAVAQRFGSSCEVVVEAGVVADRGEPLTDLPVTTPDGTPGVLLEHFLDGGEGGPGDEPVATEVRATSALVWFGHLPGVGPTTQPGRTRLTAVLTPATTGRHLLGAGGSGEATLRVDGVVVATRPAPEPGDVMGQVARAETTAGGVDLVAGVPVTVVVDLVSTGSRVRGLTVDALTPQPVDALERAVRAAREADAVVVVVGDQLTTSRESRDLATTALPPEQLELLAAVAAVNDRVVVVVNAGRPVDAPWAEDVGAVVQAWMPGQRFGPALAAVLAGDVEPGGRMPVTVTARDADRSTCGVVLDPGLELDYTGSEPTGYRHLQRTATAALFAFGHGLGYTTWRHDGHRVEDGPDGASVVRVRVANTGARAGREVVQVYVRAPGEPDARLGGFSDVELAPGEDAEVSVVLAARAFARWDVSARSWATPPGGHELLVGRSSADVGAVLVVRR